MSQGCDGQASDSGALLHRDSVLPRLVRCAAFWMNSRAVACSSLSSALRYVAVAVSMTSERRVSRSCSGEKACEDCVTDHTVNSRITCNEGSQMSRRCDVLCSLEPDS